METNIKQLYENKKSIEMLQRCIESDRRFAAFTMLFNREFIKNKDYFGVRELNKL